MTETSTKVPPRKDPLSAFLLGAAIVLAIMYGVETWSTSKLETQTLTAAKIGATGKLVGCFVGATGQRGEHLVLRCPDREPQIAVLALDQAATEAVSRHLPGFRAIRVYGSSGDLICLPRAKPWPENWPDHCSAL